MAEPKEPKSRELLSREIQEFTDICNYNCALTSEAMQRSALISTSDPFNQDLRLILQTKTGTY